MAVTQTDERLSWPLALRPLLREGEIPIAWLEIDLNSQLFYAQGLVGVTNERVISIPNAVATTTYNKNTAATDPPIEWLIPKIQGAVCHEAAGVGCLELLGNEKLLAQWHYTAKEFPAASRVAREINQLVRSGAALTREATTTVCPSCGAVLEPHVTSCPICKPAASLAPAKSLVRLLPFARPYAGLISLGLLLIVLGNLAALVQPLIVMRLIDDVLIPGWNNPQSFQPSVFIRLMVGMLLAAILAWLLRWARQNVMARASERVSANLRNVTYTHLQSLSLDYFGGKRTGDLMSRIGSDTDRINNYLTLNLLDFANDIIMIAITAVILLVMNPWLALITLFPLPAIFLLTQLLRKRMRHGFGLSARAWGSMVSVLADTIPGIRVVKAFAQERREIERFRTANAHVLQANDRVNRVWSFFDPMVGLLTDLGNLVIWVAGVWFVIHGHVTVGGLQAFLNYISRFYTRLDTMSRIVPNTQRAAAAANRIFEILDRKPSVPEPVKPVPCGRVQGRIELRDVKFQYGTRQVIKGIDFSIEPGEMIGLVGPSGAGKSTLVNLVCRFYDVVSGSILVDGVDIRSFPVEDYRRNIGMVLQEPFLFYGTVAENIAYAKPHATRGEIIAAAKAANAHDFILRLMDGYDSIVGERGQSLSGGERQRISIARALLTDPQILILDEATSSVDTQTEREIQGALDTLIRGRTTIAIAHRLSTLRSANRIVVMENGQIVETGRHEELIERAGPYFRLHRAQYELAAEEANIAPAL